MIDIIDRIKKIARRMPFVDYLFDILNSVLTLQETGGEHTPSALNTEENLIIQNSPLGSFKPLPLLISLDAMLAGDTIELRLYQRLSSGGGLEIVDYATYTGIDGGLTNGKTVVPITPYPNRFGYKITLEQTAGTERAYIWEEFEES